MRRSEGNTPLHLAMESAHGETAALLIEAGADRSRVRHCVWNQVFVLRTDARICVVEFRRADSRAARGGRRSGATTSTCLRHRSLWTADMNVGVGEVCALGHENGIRPMVSLFKSLVPTCIESESNPEEKNGIRF